VKTKVLIGAGGTGGHIYPAISIAKAMQTLNPQIEIEFVGSPRGLEKDLVTREGYVLHLLPVGQLHSSVGRIQQIKTLLRMPLVLWKAIQLVYKKKPRFVLGVGGYASGPIVLAAAFMRRQTYLWEPNEVPGWTNRILARFVSEALVVFEQAAKHLSAKKIKRVGMPVRPEISAVGQELRKIGRNRPLRILVFGGSQGSHVLNKVVSQMLIEGGPWLDHFEWVHQTGKHEFEMIKGRYSSASASVDVCPYIYDMDQRLRWADLVICRSGTGTVADLAASGKAAILIPLPTAADDHQMKNARAIAELGGAIVLPQAELTTQRLREMLVELGSHREILDSLEENIRKFHRPEADVEIARYLMDSSSL